MFRTRQLTVAAAPRAVARTWRVAALIGCFALCAAAIGETTLRVGTYGNPKAMGNPHSSTSISETYVWAAIFDSLVSVNETGDVLPALAVEWAPVDELTWHFKLRPGVEFSNGEPFDAAAVVATVDYFTSDEAASLSVTRELVSLAGASVVDPLTVEIRTKHPNIILPATLAIMRIVAPEHWRRLGPEAFAREPVGTGPFMVEKWATAKIDMVAFEGSWRAPKVDRLEVFEILDSSARLQAVQTASVDIALNLSPDDIVALERAGGKGHVSNGVGVTGMAFVTVRESPVQDVRVRQALNYAVNKEAYIAVLLDGKTVPASQPAPVGVVGHNPDLKPYPYDPDRARELLAEAGYPDGFEFVAEVVVGGTVAAGPIYQYVAQQLRQVGVKMEVRSIPIAQLIQKAVSGNWGGAAFGMEFDAKPTGDAMRPLPMHSCLRLVPWHCDESIVPSILAAQREFDAEKRLKLVHEIMRDFHERPTMLYLHESVSFDGLSRRVRNYNPVNRRVNFSDIEIVE